MELPKVYEPVESLDELQDRLNMFLTQYNDMIRGHGMDLVFFQDAVEHLIKVYSILLVISELNINVGDCFPSLDFTNSASSRWERTPRRSGWVR